MRLILIGLVSAACFSSTADVATACQSESLGFCLASLSQELTGVECPDDLYLGLSKVKDCSGFTEMTCDIKDDIGLQKIGVAYIYTDSPLLAAEGCLIVDMIFNNEDSIPGGQRGEEISAESANNERVTR